MEQDRVVRVGVVGIGRLGNYHLQKYNMMPECAIVGVADIVEEMPSVEELAKALNALGVSSREMMAIFQSLKRAGALQAEVVIN